MEPAFFRGDLLFLTNYQSEPIRVGEVCVFKIRERDIPIVHRIHAVHEECVWLQRSLQPNRVPAAASRATSSS
jgi:hypothetical protein